MMTALHSNPEQSRNRNEVNRCMMNLCKVIAIGCLLFINAPLQAQTDSLPAIRQHSFQKSLDKITSSRAYQMTYIGVPLIIGGLIVKSEDDDFRGLRNDYLPGFRWYYDDYLQYAPAAIMLGLKAAGVKSRSSWGRMLVSDAFTIAIMAGTVQIIKNSANVERPDGSNRHSFPSGHTATAFMTATMLSKEYGDRSAWYSIGAYSAAAATGLSRMVNNKHWLSDVLTGAGIGILSTELGYFLADLIYKERGLNHFNTTESFDRMRHPSFFGIFLGLNITPGQYRLNNNSLLKFSSGSTAGLEGAWYMNPYIGLGGRLGATNIEVILDGEAQDKSFAWLSAHAGAYFSYPLSSRFLTEGKLLAGYNYFSKCDLPTLALGERGGIGMLTGCSFTFLAKEQLGVKFYIDYSLISAAIPSSKKYVQMVSLGSGVTVAF